MLKIIEALISSTIIPIMKIFRVYLSIINILMSVLNCKLNNL